MRNPLLVFCFAAATTLGCQDKPPTPPAVNQVMPNLPVPPQAQVVSRSGSEDALLIRLSTPVGTEEIESYYRGILSREPWQLVSDTRMADGALALYAERQGPPLWVTVRKNAGGPGTIVELSGAVVDAAPQAPVPADSGSS